MNINSSLFGLPTCIQSNICRCFEHICNPVQQFRGLDIEKTIIDNIKCVDIFYIFLQQHITKDSIYNIHKFSHVPAFEIKRALDNISNTLNYFEFFVSQSLTKDFLIHTTHTSGIAGKALIAALKNSIDSHTKLILILNSPHESIKIEVLINLLEIYLFCLHLFYQFNNLIKHGCNFYGKLEILSTSYKITLSICR